MWTPAKARSTIDRCVGWQATGGVLPDMLVVLLRFYRWLLADECKIRDMHGKIVPLHPNETQLILLAAMLAQAFHGHPIRLDILKARKRGVSTFVQAFMYFVCRVCENQLARMLANVAVSTGEIFEIGKTVAQHDVLARQWKLVDSLSRELRFIETNSRYQCHTAGSGSHTGVGGSSGGGATVGGTPSMIHNSELALWPGDKRSVLAEALNSVPFLPNTAIFNESTARGRELFYEHWEAAQADDHPYEPIFIPWFFNEDNRIATEPLERDDGEHALVRYAHQMYDMILPDAALAWRRMKIKELGALLFCREHPATPQEAVQTAAGLVLPGLRECVVDELPFDYTRIPNHERVGGWDYGYNDPCALINAVVWDNAIWVIGVERGRNMLADDMANADYVLPRHTYYCDPSALGPRKEFAAACVRKGIPAYFTAAPSGRGDKETDRVVDEWDRVRRLQTQGRLWILDTAADQLVLESDNFFYNEKTGKPEYARSDSCGHFDTLDALRYLVCGVGLTVRMPARKPPVRSTRRAELRRWGRANAED